MLARWDGGGDGGHRFSHPTATDLQKKKHIKQKNETTQKKPPKSLISQRRRRKHDDAGLTGQLCVSTQVIGLSAGKKIIIMCQIRYGGVLLVGSASRKSVVLLLLGCDVFISKVKAKQNRGLWF